MRVTLFKIGSFSVKGYGFMIGIGFLVALIVGSYRAKKKGMSDEAVIDLALLCGILGFTGAKVLYILTVIPQFISSWFFGICCIWWYSFRRWSRTYLL